MKLNRGQLLTHIFSLMPVLLTLVDISNGNLSANPIQFLTLRSGRTSIYLLLFTLLASPMINIFGLTAFIQIRKITGLYALFYALFHFLIYVMLDFQLNFSWVIDEISNKPFLQIGLGSLLILLLLGITSLNLIKRSLKRNWKHIQSLVYPAAGLAIIHNFMAAKGDKFIPLLQIFIFTILLILKIKAINRTVTFTPLIFNKINQFLLSNL